MKIIVNIPGWIAAVLTDESGKPLIIGGTPQLDIAEGLSEINIKLEKAYPKPADKPMNANAESGASGSLSFA